MRLYKRKYILALYDKDDELVTVLDDGREFAAYMGYGYDEGYEILNGLMKGKRDKCYLDGKPIYVYFIDMTEGEDEDK